MHPVTRVVLLVAAMVSAGWTTPALAAVPRGSPAMSCDGTWKVQSPDPRGVEVLKGVVALTPTDAWAAGVRFPQGSGYREHAFVEHWDGTAWTGSLAAPLHNVFESELADISASSPTDVWAVGHEVPNPADGTPYGGVLTEHWDGTSWIQVKNPQPYADAFATAVDARAADDVWIVGAKYPAPGTVSVPFALHWNGSAWALVPIPAPAQGRDSLFGVTAVAPNDVWAVGEHDSGGGTRALFEHWNGTSWTVLMTSAAHLTAVDGLSTTDAMAVGASITVNGARSFSERWNGASWSSVPTPPRPSPTLNGVAMATTSAGWAVGYAHPPGAIMDAAVEGWDGSAWAVVPSPGFPNSAWSVLYDVSTLPSGEAWAVGERTDQAGEVDHALIEHVC